MKDTELIHPNMIPEFTHSEPFALKMKAWSFLRCRHLGMDIVKIESLYGIKEEVANSYEAEWAQAHGYILA